jgi:HemK-related putative methylase
MYTPSDDSYFFKEFLEKQLSKKKSIKNFSVLDMGSGSGILAETCSKYIDKRNILCVDLKKDCISSLDNQGFNVLRSNLFSKVSNLLRFDLILFNAPYLPLDKLEDKESKIETTGGKHGDEISLRFLEKARNYLKANGKIFLLVSTLTPLNKIYRFKPKILARKKIWFEELIILGFNKSQDI